MPAHNAEKYLDECVQSITAQTYSNFELILVDDASTDKTGAIINRHAAADARIKALHVNFHETGLTRNAGIDASTGEYICFLDADDAYAPYALQFMFDGLISNAADMVIAQFDQCDHQRFACIPKSSWRTIDGLSAAINILYQKDLWHCSACAKLYRQEIVSGKGKFAESVFYEDLEASPRHCLASTRVAISPAKVYFYRTTPKSKTNTWSEKRLGALKAADMNLETALADGDSVLIRAAESRRFSAYSNIMVLALRNGNETIARSCWDTIKTMRSAIMRDGRVRRKNKIGATVFGLGFGFLKMIVPCRTK